jgi:hypothetical protein
MRREREWLPHVFVGGWGDWIKAPKEKNFSVISYQCPNFLFIQPIPVAIATVRLSSKYSGRKLSLLISKGMLPSNLLSQSNLENNMNSIRNLSVKASNADEICNS